MVTRQSKQKKNNRPSYSVPGIIHSYHLPVCCNIIHTACIIPDILYYIIHACVLIISKIHKKVFRRLRVSCTGINSFTQQVGVEATSSCNGNTTTRTQNTRTKRNKNMRHAKCAGGRREGKPTTGRDGQLSFIQQQRQQSTAVCNEKTGLEARIPGTGT